LTCINGALGPKCPRFRPARKEEEYAVNQSNLDELLSQTRFQLFVGVEFATQPTIAFDRCASALERSLHELEIEGIEVMP
jgi:hypothetical protein